MKSSQKVAMMGVKADPRKYGKKRPYDGGHGYRIDRFVSMMPAACSIVLNAEPPDHLTEDRYSWVNDIIPVRFQVISASTKGVLVMACGPNKGEDDVLFKIAAKNAMMSSLAGIGEVQEVVMEAAQDALKHIKQNHELFRIMESKG